MPEFFVEILSEEIPARMQRRAAGDLKRLVTDHLVHAGLTYEGAYASATPRRLVLSVQGLPARSADRKQERKGPRVGAPQKALEGFLRAAGLQSIDEAETVSDSKKGDFYVARSIVEGRDAVAVCADALGAAIKDFPWPVSMRWGAASVEPTSMRWVRPMTSIVATFGADNEDPVVVPVPINDVPVGDETVGHRFHAPGPIKVRRLDDYQTALAQAHVVVDLDRRREQIRDDARTAVFALGLELVDDDGLLEEVAGLVEWPVVLVGHFDETTLSLPDEVIRLTIRENQKCFVTRNPATGELANAFVLTANLTTQDGGEMVKKGNERVVRARLADARFFYEQDLKLPLDTHLTTLKAVTFHDKLGSQWDRVERIATLAERIAPSVGADPQLAARAARLAKADLATQMVGEFPELQGYMGRRYAMAAGEADAVAAAIETHYAPLGPKDDVPTEPVAIAVALADKLDQLFFLWAAGEKPTGSGDPFALRRAALGIIRIILDNTLRVPLSRPDGSGLIADAWARHKGSDPFDRLCGGETGAQDGGDQRQFLIERLIVQQRDNGVSADVVKAIIPALATIDLVDITNRIAALQTFLASDDGVTLMAGYRRAANILKAEEKKDEVAIGGAIDTSALTAPEEVALHAAIVEARTGVADRVAAEDYAGAMGAIAGLRVPVDAFFDGVMVNVDDDAIRANRLRLLSELRGLTTEVADFSQISL